MSPTYGFILRFKLPDRERVNCDQDEIPIGQYFDGEIALQPANGSFADSNELLIAGKRFPCRESALTAADVFKNAVRWAGVELQMGLNLGETENSVRVLTNAGKLWLADRVGCPVESAMDQITIYEERPGLIFAGFECSVTVASDGARIRDAICAQAEKTGECAASRSQFAADVFAHSFFDSSPQASFLTLITSVEMLLLPEAYELSQEIQCAIKKLQQAIKSDTSLDDDDKQSICSQAGNLKEKSIGRRSKCLIKRLVPELDLDGEKPDIFWSTSYGLRSNLVHEGPKDSICRDMAHRLPKLRKLISSLLLAHRGIETERNIEKVR